MREIKFRAWNKLKKIMVYEDEDNSSVYLDGWCASDVQVLNQTLNSKFVKDIYKFMQYTGLKDKNGKEIYEGDILEIPEWLLQDNQDKCICIYAEEYQTSEIIGFGLYIKDGYSGEYKILVPSDEWDEFEVIGNIYDNPELLKGE